MPATVTVVNVGQGDCTVVVDAETRSALIIDCHLGHSQTAFDELEKLGFSELKAAVVTHSHRDHIGGMLDALYLIGERFKGTIFFNLDTLLAMRRTDENENAIRTFITDVLKLEGSRSRAESDLPEQELGRTTWKLIAPSRDELLRAVEAGNPNLASGIVHIESGDQHMIVGGDAQLDSWQAVHAQLPSKAVVRWPHHGGSVSTAQATQRKLKDQLQLLNLLQPSDVLVSVGGNNTHSHPQDEFFQAARQHGLAPVCTQATAKCTGDSSGKRCAGSITVELGTGSAPMVTTEEHDHAGFVEMLASPQCSQRGRAT